MSALRARIKAEVSFPLKTPEPTLFYDEPSVSLDLPLLGKTSPSLGGRPRP